MRYQAPELLMPENDDDDDDDDGDGEEAGEESFGEPTTKSDVYAFAMTCVQVSGNESRSRLSPHAVAAPLFLDYPQFRSLTGAIINRSSRVTPLLGKCEMSLSCLL